MRSLLRRWLPPEQELRGRPMLRWLGPLLGKPWLWSTSRRGVSVGVAIGLFFGFLLPLGQALAAGAFAVWARANLPIAVAVTLVSNPLTTPGILAGAYYIGATALGVAPGAPAEAGLTLLERVHTVGGPLAAGLAILATVVSAAGFVLVQVAWRVASYARLMRRRRATVRA